MTEQPTASLNFPRSVSGNPIRWLIVGGGFLIAAIAIGATVMAGNFRERALNSSARELENTVLLLARHFDQQLQDFGAIQQDVAAFVQVLRHRNQRALQAADVQRGHSPDAQGQDRRILLCRQHQPVRCGRRDDQFLHRLAGAARQRRRPGLFQDLQVGPKIALAAGRTGPQPRHRRLDHRACPQADRTERRIPGGRSEEASSPPPLRNSSHRWRLDRMRRLPCTIATARCWRAILMSRR